jgi:hypothetical protein
VSRLIHRIQQISNVDSAVETLAQSKIPDVIIAGAHLPGMGSEIAKERTSGCLEGIR